MKCCVSSSCYLNVICLFIVLYFHESDGYAVTPKTLSPLRILQSYSCNSVAMDSPLDSIECSHFFKQNDIVGKDLDKLITEYAKIFNLIHCTHLTNPKTSYVSKRTENGAMWCKINNGLSITVEPERNQNVVLSIIEMKPNVERDHQKIVYALYADIENQNTTGTVNTTSNTTIPTTKTTNTTEPPPPASSTFSIIIGVVITITVLTTMTVICCLGRRNNVNNESPDFNGVAFRNQHQPSINSETKNLQFLPKFEHQEFGQKHLNNSPAGTSNEGFHLNEEHDYSNNNGTNSAHLVPTAFVHELKKVCATNSNSPNATKKSTYNANNNELNKVPMMPPKSFGQKKPSIPNGKKAGMFNQGFEENEYKMDANDKKNSENEGIYSALNLENEVKDDLYETSTDISNKTSSLLTDVDDYLIPVVTESKNNTTEDNYVCMDERNNSTNHAANTNSLEGHYVYMDQSNGYNNSNKSDSHNKNNVESHIYEDGYLVPAVSEIESETEGLYVPMTENNKNDTATPYCREPDEEDIYDDTISPENIYSNGYEFEPQQFNDSNVDNNNKKSETFFDDDCYVVPSISEQFTYVDKFSDAQKPADSSEYDHGYMISPMTERKDYSDTISHDDIYENSGVLRDGNKDPHIEDTNFYEIESD